MMRYYSALFILLLISSLDVTAQSYSTDVVHLTNGKIVTGSISDISENGLLQLELINGEFIEFSSNEYSSYSLDFSLSPVPKNSYKYRFKSQSIAVGLSLLVPGSGHLYSERPLKGVIIGSIAYGSLIGGYQLAKVNDLTCVGLECRSEEDLNFFYAGLGLYTAATLYAMIDSRIQVKRYNQKLNALIKVIPDEHMGKNLPVVGIKYNF